MGRHSTATPYQLQRLLRYGATLHAIAERQCNGYGDIPGRPDWDEQAELADDGKQVRMEDRVSKLCAEFGASASFQHDPRGCTVKIVVPDGYTNDFGREGICVPTS